GALMLSMIRYSLNQKFIYHTESPHLSLCVCLLLNSSLLPSERLLGSQRVFLSLSLSFANKHTHTHTHTHTQVLPHTVRDSSVEFIQGHCIGWGTESACLSTHTKYLSML